MHAMSAMPATSDTSDPLPHDEPARQALRLAAAALDAAQALGQAPAISAALARMAHSLAALHALAQAESYLDSALRWKTRALRLMAPDTTTPIDRQVLPGLGQMIDH